MYLIEFACSGMRSLVGQRGRAVLRPVQLLKRNRKAPSLTPDLNSAVLCIHLAQSTSTKCAVSIKWPKQP